MLACVDVSYRAGRACAGCLVFRSWEDPEPVARYTARVARVKAYRPGRFYLRELPCVLAVLRRVREPLDVIIVDGYVWLDARGRPGLGARLYEALGGRVAVVGVAKSSFRGSEGAVRVYRGRSRRPLYVTAVGIAVEEAAERVRRMHGSFRQPTLLKEVDALCRGRAER